MSEMWTRCSFALNRSLKLIYFTFFECLLCVSRLAFRNVLPWFLRLPVGRTFIQWIYSSISFFFCPPFGFSPKIWHSLQLFCQIYGPSLLSRQNHSALVTDVSYGRDIRFACGCSGFNPRFALFRCQTQRNHALQITNCLIPISWVERFQFAIITFTRGANKKN